MKSAICQQSALRSSHLFGAAGFERFPTASGNPHSLPSKKGDKLVPGWVCAIPSVIINAHWAVSFVGMRKEKW